MKEPTGENDIRQGDVTLLEVLEIPSEAVLTKTATEITVALGEQTGHHHTLYSKVPMELFTWNEKRYLKIKGDVDLKHQQHALLKPKPAMYEITIEREYDYFERTIKQTRD